MGPGSHVGFPISAKNKNLVYDHPMNISANLVQICFVVSETRGSGEPVSLTWIKAAFNNNATALWRPSWWESVTAGHNFGRGTSNDYSIKVWF